MKSITSLATIFVVIAVAFGLIAAPKFAEAQTIAQPTMFAVEQIDGTGDVKVSWDWAQGSGSAPTTFQTIIFNELRTHCTRTNVDPGTHVALVGTSYSVSFNAMVQAASGNRNRSMCQTVSGTGLDALPLLNSFDVGTKYVFRLRALNLDPLPGFSSQWADPDVPELTITTPTEPTAATPKIALTVDKDTYTEGTDSVITVTATATPAPSADLTVNVRVEGGGIAGFFSGSGDVAHNNTITILSGETTGTVDYTIHNDGHQEDDTTAEVMASVREPVPAGAYSFDNTDAPTFMVSNDDQQPDSPTITSVAALDGSIALAWSAPSDTGSRDITNYAVCVDTVAAQLRNNACDFGLADFEFSADQDGDSSDTDYHYTVTGLTNDTAYYVGVAARNGVTRTVGNLFPGISEYAVYQESDADATVTPNEAAGTPPSIVLSTDKAAYVEGTDDAIEITATASSAPSAELTVNVRVEGGGVGGFYPTVGGDGRFNNTITINAGETTGTVNHAIHNDAHQEADTTDQVMVIVRGADTAGAYTFDNTSPPTLMVSNDDQQSAAPTLTSVTAGDGSITVVWSAPSDTGSRDLRNYSICLAATVNAVRNNNCDAASKTTFEFNEDQGTVTTDTSYEYTVTGLTGGTAYYVGVATRNGVSRTQGANFPGVSVYALHEEPAGTAATVTPMGTTPTGPAAPTAVTATPGDGEIEVTWTAVTTTPAPDQYAICYIRQTETATATADLARTACDNNAHPQRGVTNGASPLTLTADGHLDGADTNGQAYFVFVSAIYGSETSEWAAATPNPVTPMAAGTTTPLPDTALTALSADTVTFAETFAHDTFDYTADIAVTVTDFVLTAVPVAGATVEVTAVGGRGATVTDNGDNTYDIDIADGAANIRLEVTITDASNDEGYYNIVITRPTPAPAMPTGFSATGGNMEFTYMWNAPASDTTQPMAYTVCFVAGDDVALITDAACGSSNTAIANGDSTTITISDGDGDGDGITITNGTSYVVGIRADHNANDNSMWATFGPVTPTAPAADDATFSALTFYVGTDTSGAEITPTPAFVAGAMVTSYALEVAATVTDITVAYATTNPAATLQDDAASAVSGGTYTYNFGAQATATAQLEVFPVSGTSVLYSFQIAREATATPPDAPDAPTAVTATRGAPDRVDVSWSAPATAPDGYQVCVLTQVQGDNFDRDCVAGRYAEAAGSASSLEVHNRSRTIDANTNDFSLPGSSVQDNLVNNIAVRSFTGEGATRTFSAWVADANNPLEARLSTDATLSRLELTDGTNMVAITPTFTAGSTETTYTASVDNSVTTVTLRADATVREALPVITSAQDNDVPNTPAGAFFMNEVNGVVDLAPGANVLTVTVTAEDEMTTATYTVTVTRGDATGMPDPTPSTPPTLTITPATPTVTEADGAMVSFTVTSDMPAPSGGLAVTVTLSGGDDFVVAGARTRTVTIAAGMTTATVNFPITNDEVVEDNAVVTATIGDSDAYTGDGATATATIVNDDVPPSMTPDAFSFDARTGVAENTPITSNVITVGGLGDGISVEVMVSDGDTITVTDTAGTAITDGMVSNGDMVSVMVTAADRCGQSVTATVTIGGVSDTFTVTTRACRSDSTLSDITLSDGLMLSPMFVPGTTRYNIEEIPEGVTEYTVTATATDTTTPATVTINGESSPETVAITDRVIIVVTAENGTTTTYTIGGGELTEAAMESLPAVTRAIAGQISNAIGGRINAAVSNVSSGINLANLGDETVLANFVADNEMNAKQILANNDFVLPLNAGGGAGGLSSLSFWASGGFGGINGDENTADWGGDFSNANLGLDAKVGDDWLIGLALSKTDTEIDYKDSAMPGDDGEYDLNLSGVHPYFAYIGDRFTFSASLGEADGELEINNDTKHDADLSTYTLAAGMRLSQGSLQPNLTFDITQTELTVADAGDDGDQTSDANLAKLTIAIAPKSGQLQTNLRLGIRHESGDGATGTSAEFRAGVAYDTGRVKTSADLHLIDGDREYGISGSVRLQPGSDGQGLSLTMQPSYSDEMELTANIAYGIGKVTPYLNASTNKNEYGLQWQPTKQIGMKLANEQTKTNNAIKLTTEIDF